jgi:uncharacterized phage-associated protein
MTLVKMAYLFDEKKSAEVAAFFLLKAAARNSSTTLLKLMKLMYLAERDCYRLHAHPMIGDALVSMPNGPVLSKTLDLINSGPQDRKEESYWDTIIAEREDRLMALRSDTRVKSANDLLQLSEADIEILEDIWSKFDKYSAYSLVKFTHDSTNCPEWKDPDGSSIPIDMTEMLASMGYLPDEINSILGNMREQAQSSEMFSINA